MAFKFIFLLIVFHLIGNCSSNKECNFCSLLVSKRKKEKFNLNQIIQKKNNLKKANKHISIYTYYNCLRKQIVI